MLTKRNKIFKAAVSMIGVNLFLLAVFFFLPNFGGTEEDGTMPFIVVYLISFASVIKIFSKYWLKAWAFVLGDFAVLGFIVLSIYFLVRKPFGEIKVKLFIVFLILQLISCAYLIGVGTYPYIHGVMVNGQYGELAHYVHFLIIAIVMATLTIAQIICFTVACRKEKKEEHSDELS